MTDTRAGGMPLERRLALLISGLLAVVVVAYGLAAWRQMRDASIARATERLTRVARQLAASSDAGRPRAAALRSVAATRELSSLVTSMAPDPAARAAAVEKLRSLAPDTTVVGWEVWNLAEERRLSVGPAVGGRDAVALAPVRAAAISSGTARRSALYIRDDSVFYWTAVPVLANGQVAGVLAERRRLNRSQRTGDVIRGIVGDETSVYFASVPDGDWVEASGAPATKQFTLPDTLAGAVRLIDHRGTPMYAAVGAVASTQWLIVLAQPEAAILRRAYDFLRTMLGIGALLLLGGAAAAWLLGRHVTRPLRDLTRAAESLAAGDYSQRVDVRGSAEIAQLSARFNAMAAAIGDAHRELAERNAALQQANEAKSRFLAMMSHELRTPLNAIGGYTELLELGLRGPVTDAQVDDLKRIRRSRDHLLSIITDILGFSRADAGQLTLELRAVPLQEVLAEAESALHQQAMQQHRVRLEVVPAPPELYALADREKLQQVVFNLVTNAIRFTDADGLARVWASATDAMVTIHVRDNGIGIPPDKLSTIFDPFVQVDATLTRRVGGTGLGLAIVRELTDAMRGSIHVDSTPGAGSHFSVTFPRVVVPAGQPSNASAERSSAST